MRQLIWIKKQFFQDYSRNYLIDPIKNCTTFVNVSFSQLLLHESINDDHRYRVKGRKRPNCLALTFLRTYPRSSLDEGRSDSAENAEGRYRELRGESVGNAENAWKLDARITLLYRFSRSQRGRQWLIYVEWLDTSVTIC